MLFSEEKAFYEFRKEHPELRFWQALRHFAEADKIIIIREDREHDTFYWADVK